MQKEAVLPHLDETTLVLNPRSGNTKRSQKMAIAIEKHWPHGTLAIQNFYDVLKNPTLIQGTNIIAIAGDGSISTLARLHHLQNESQWFLPLDGGSLGVVCESLGLGRKIKESPQHYANRILSLLQTNTLEITQLTPGAFTPKALEQEDPSINEGIFFWNIGAGEPSRYAFALMDIRRGKFANGLHRSFVFITAMLNRFRTTQPFNLTIGNTTQAVYDAHIIKDPFKDFHWFALPQEGDVIAAFPAGNPNTQTLKAIFDGVQIVFGLPPRMGGVVINSLGKNETVVFHSNNPNLPYSVDSEHYTLDTPLTAQAQAHNTHPIQVVKQARRNKVI